MSADNGIYILKTLGPEYRVKHLQGAENYAWGDGDFTEDQNIWIQNAREMWKGCEVFTDEGDALKEAKRQYDECGYCEYGMCEIVIDRKFEIEPEETIKNQATKCNDCERGTYCPCGNHKWCAYILEYVSREDSNGFGCDGFIDKES